MRTFFHKILFHDRDRNNVVISDTAIVRLNPDFDSMFEFEYYFGCVQLQTPNENVNREYLETEVYKPQAVQTWNGIQFIYDEPENTAIYIRVVVGSTDLFWDGAAFRAAVAGEWNTIEEIQSNFASLAPSNEGVKFKIAPSSIGNETPRVFEIRIIWSGFVSELEELLIDSLVASLKIISSVGDIALEATTAGTNVGFDPATDLSDFIFVDVAAAYNERTDADHKKNIFGSFDAPNKQIVLTESANQGDSIFVKFIYNPSVFIAANQDFYEVAKYPVITLEDISETRIRRPNGKEKIVTGFSPNRTGYKFTAARQSDFEITLGIISGLNVDQTRLASATVRFLESLKQIVLSDTDERVDLILVDLYRSNFNPGRSDVRRGEIRLRLLNVTFWNDPETVTFPDRFITDYFTDGARNSDETIVEKEN